MEPGASPGGGPRRGRFARRRSANTHGASSPRATYNDITNCYRLILGREPDPHGYNGYKSILDAGRISRDDLVGYFLSAPEFHDRLAKNFEYGVGIPEAVRVGDLTYYVDPNDAAIGAGLKAQGVHEPDVTDVVTRY